MTSSPSRYKRLIKEIPKHKYIKDAVIASGFTESVAKTQAKRVVQSAIKQQAREYLEERGFEGKTSKVLAHELVGLSREDLYSLLRKIAHQDKDYGSALKVISPLVKPLGVVLSTDDTENKGTSVINVLVEKNDLPIIEGKSDISTSDDAQSTA